MAAESPSLLAGDKKCREDFALYFSLPGKLIVSFFALNANK
jgi:hypothetical protein